MIVSLRRSYGDYLTSGAQAALLLVALVRPAPWAALGACALTAALSLPAWLSATRRHRAIADTPTSRVDSAAQGYAELRGHGKAFGGTPLISPVTGRPCLWYRYRIERREDDRWVPDGSGESDASFILDDGSAQCIVDPEGAEMLIARKERWSADHRRYTQWSLVERDTLYALGEFRTRGAVDLQLDRHEDIKQLLAQWKAERGELLKRFDVNGDGQIDLQEWELARQQARRQIEREHREARSQSEAHLMQRPVDGRLYLISDLAPERLARRYRIWSWVHLGFFFTGLAWFGWLWQQG